MIFEDLQNLALRKDLYFCENFGFSIVNKRFFIEIHPEYLILGVDQSGGRKTIATNPLGIKLSSILTLTLTLAVNDMLMRC